jgi:hypothetical protein
MKCKVPYKLKIGKSSEVKFFILNKMAGIRKKIEDIRGFEILSRVKYFMNGWDLQIVWCFRCQSSTVHYRK